MPDIVVTIAQIQARMGTQAYTKAFAQNGQASVDTAWLQTHLTDAIGAAISHLKQNFRDELPQALVDHPLIIRAVISMTLAYACEYSPGGGAGANQQQPGPYDMHRSRAIKILDEIANDTIRATDEEEGPEPRARIANDVDDAGNPTNPFSRAADYRTKSAY